MSGQVELTLAADWYLLPHNGLWSLGIIIIIIINNTLFGFRFFNDIFILDPYLLYDNLEFSLLTTLFYL